jgi:UPF0716 family protein affecting phage T7 exclusion
MTVEQALSTKLAHVLMGVVIFMIGATLAATIGGWFGILLWIAAAVGGFYLCYLRFSKGWTVVEAVRKHTTHAANR